MTRRDDPHGSTARVRDIFDTSLDFGVTRIESRRSNDDDAHRENDAMAMKTSTNASNARQKANAPGPRMRHSGNNGDMKRVREPRARARDAVATRATKWILDKPGCASARSEDDGEKIKNVLTSKSCLAVPIDVDALGSNHLEFVGADVKFAARERELEISTLRGTCVVNGKTLTSGKKAIVKAGSKIVVGDEEFMVYRNARAHA